MLRRIQAQGIVFLPEQPDDACHIKTPAGQRLQLDTEKVMANNADIGTLAVYNIQDRSDNNLITVPTGTTNRLEFAAGATVDFNNCTVQGLSGVGGGSVDAQAVASNNSNPASGSAYGTVDAELDDIQTRVSANTSRTTGLTASRILVSSGAGTLSAGNFDQTDIVRKSVTGGQTLSGPLTVGGEVNIPDGSTYKVNSVALASSNLSDGATLSKLAENEVHTGNRTFSGSVDIIGANDIAMNKAATIQQFDVAFGAFVGGSNVEYTAQQGCIKKTDDVALTATKYTANASDQTDKTNAHGFLRVSNGTTGEVVNTGEVVMADSAITQTINGNKTFSSSLTVGSGSTNAFISAGGYLQLTTPSGTNGEIKFNKAGSVHTLTMNDLGTAADNLSFDANFNLTAGNNFKIDGAQLQVSNLSDGAQIQKENTDAMKLTDAAYTASAADASGKTGAHGFLQVIEQTSGLIANTAEVVRADGGINQTVDGSKTFSASLTVGDISANNYGLLSTLGILSLRKASGGAGLHLGASGAVQVLENSGSDGIDVNGHVDIPTGSNYLINGAQISSDNLSNNNLLAKTNASNTFTSAQTLNGSAIFGVTGANASQATFGESGATQFSIGKTTATSSSLDIHTDTTTADISVTFGSGAGLTIPMRITDDTVEMSSSTDTEASMRYKTASYAGSANASPVNEVVTRADVSAFLTSAGTSNSVKLNILEAGGGTGFDGSSTSLTINHLNPVVIKATKHIPDGAGGYTAHPAGTLNTFDVDCLCECNNGLTVGGAAHNFLARGGVTDGGAIADVQVLLNQLLARSPTAWAPDFVNVGINGSGATVEMTAGLAVSIQPTIIRTRYGTDGSGNAIYKIEMRGRIQKSGGNFSTATTLFTAPTGYRASQEHNFIAQGHTGVAQARIDVATNGNVTLITDGSDALGFVNLSTVSYWTA